jgi:DNA-binding transcriptional MerR regulator
MTTFSQITMKFVEDSSPSSEAAEIQKSGGDLPVNVGVRLKKLKSVESAGEPENRNVPQSEDFSLPLAPESPTAMSVLGESEDSEIMEEADIPYRSADPVLKIKSGRGRKSIKQISEEADLIQIPEDEVLFQKHYYTMGEVADMFRVNQSLLRFWEAEFAVLQPKKNKKGDRYFRPVDIKNLHLIYHLLRQRKYTIEGAKDFLKNNKKSEEKFETIKKLEEVKRFLLEMKASLR